MAGIRAIISLAFGCAFGIAFLVLSCVIPQPNNFVPLSLIAFYFVAPIPFLIARRMNDFGSFDSSTGGLEVALFVTVFFVVSAFGLPIVLAHTGTSISWTAAGFAIAANVVVFACIVVCLILFTRND